MNEKIKQLAEEAGFDLYEDGNFYSSPLGQWINQEICQFADLIIDRCVRACVEDIADPRDTVELQCAQKIKRKFGVEE